MCVRDRFVLRRVTDCLKGEEKVFNAFSVLSRPVCFHSDVRKVYLKYIARVETMIGHEISAQLLADLRVSEVDTLGSLRKLKRDRSQSVKSECGVKCSVEGSSEVKVVKKKRKRKRRKKKIGDL